MNNDLAYLSSNMIHYFCLLFLFYLCAVASWIDWRSRKIPNKIIIMGLKGASIALLFEALIGQLWINLFSRFSAGFLAAILHYIPYISGKMGAGDLKLAFIIGLLLGWPAWIRFLSCYGLVLGLSAILIVILFKQYKTRSLPLAPFMGGAFLLYLLQNFRM